MFPVISDADPPPFENARLTAWLCERLRYCEIQGPMGVGEADYVSMFPVISDADPPPFENAGLPLGSVSRLRSVGSGNLMGLGSGITHRFSQ